MRAWIPTFGSVVYTVLGLGCSVILAWTATLGALTLGGVDTDHVRLGTFLRLDPWAASFLWGVLCIEGGKFGADAAGIRQELRHRVLGCARGARDRADRHALTEKVEDTRAKFGGQLVHALLYRSHCSISQA